MGITDFVHRQTPHLTPVMILGTASFLGPFLGLFSSEMEALSNKPVIAHLGIAILAIIGKSGSVGCLGLFAFMSQAYGKLMAARDQERLNGQTPLK